VSSVSSRTAAPSSRHPMERVPNVSAAAHARKPASGRPPARPQTSFGFAHSDRNSSSTCSSSRPVSSMDSRDADHSVNGNVLGKRKGMKHLSSAYKSGFRQPAQPRPPERPRGSYDRHMNYTSDWSPSVASSRTSPSLPVGTRVSSLSAALEKLSLDPSTAPVDQPMDSAVQLSPSRSKLPKPNPDLKPAPSCPSFFSPPPSTPRTPRITKRPQRHSPSKVNFLTRDSNLKAWDESAKMDAINAMMSQFLTSYEGATNRGIQLTEVMEVYKSRSTQLHLSISSRIVLSY
jgi:hypothetical protein